MSYVIGVDIGGTFTDCTVIATDGTVTIAKAPSSPPDFETGFLAAVEQAARALGTDLAALVGKAGGIYHGCTVGTNALVEGKTAPAALLTTRGHRDSILFMQSGRRLRETTPEYIAHVAGHEKPAPLIPKRLIGEIDERVAFDGHALVELNEETARAVIAGLVDQGVQAFAISLLWSIANPAHEERLAELVALADPRAYVSVSSRIVPRAGEYERTVATVINSLVGPAMDSYLAEVERRLAEMGYRAPLQVMTCTGGLITSHEARRLPVFTIGSGPVGGVIGSLALSAEQTSAASNGTAPSRVKQGSVITADMGGTTLDVGVIHAGAPLRRPTAWHGQYEYFVPTVDVRSVGSGGGSIVRFESSDGTLRVGPESAGARPGPACYGHGGTRATVSDADLVLGYLNPANFIGGEMSLNEEAARAALERAGDALGFDAERVAAAAVRIVDSQMADAIRLASVQQGHDPREFSLYAFGGAGPIHGAAIARQLGMSEIVVPLSDLASGWSAFGVAGSEALVIEQVAVALIAPFDVSDLNGHWAALERAVRGRMVSQGIDPARILFTRIADMRYPLQVNQVPVFAPGGEYDDDATGQLIDAYEREYARLFGEGTGYAEAGYAITGLRVEGRAAISEFRLARAPSGGPMPSPSATRRVTFVDGPDIRTETTSVFVGSALPVGGSVDGPALLEYPNTSVVVPHGASAVVDGFGSLVLHV